MQITAELDSQHLDKLHTLEKALKNTSELIAFAIDEIFTKKSSKNSSAKCLSTHVAIWLYRLCGK